MYEQAVKAWAEKNGWEKSKDFSTEEAAPQEPKSKNFGLGNLEDGTVIYYPGDTLVEGDPVLIGSEEGEPLADGSYRTEGEEGVEFTVAGGMVDTIGAAEDEAEEEAPVEEDSAAEGSGVEGLLSALAPYLKDFQAANVRNAKANAKLSEKLVELEKAFAKSPASTPTVDSTPVEIQKDYSHLSPKNAAKSARLDEIIKLKHSQNGK